MNKMNWMNQETQDLVDKYQQFEEKYTEINGFEKRSPGHVEMISIVLEQCSFFSIVWLLFSLIEIIIRPFKTADYVKRSHFDLFSFMQL